MATEDNSQLECDLLKELIASAEAALKEINDARESMVRTLSIIGGWVIAILGLISGRVLAPTEFIRQNVTNFTIFAASAGCLLMSILIIGLVYQGLIIPTSEQWMGQKKVFQDSLKLQNTETVLTEEERLRKRLQIYKSVIDNDTVQLAELRKFYKKSTDGTFYDNAYNLFLHYDFCHHIPFPTYQHIKIDNYIQIPYLNTQMKNMTPQRQPLTVLHSSFPDRANGKKWSGMTHRLE